MSDGPATRYVFVTGGVVSALGKGIVAASLGRLLKARGLRVQAQKFDPYLNVDPGTMSPFQHGEVFVTEDGAETDLDLGHYERFVDENLSRNASHSAGRDLGHGAPQGAQGRVPRRDRAGDPAHHERDQGADPARGEDRSGGRRDHRDRRHGRRHRVAAVPRGAPAVPPRGRTGERALPPRHARPVHRGGRRAEDEADAALRQRAAPDRDPPRRGRLPLARPALRRDPRQDRALRRRRPARRVLVARRARRLPRARAPAWRKASTRSSASASGSRPARPSSGSGRSSPSGSASGSEEVEIALVGKYVKLHDAYLSVHEALKHAGVAAGAGVRVRWVDAEDMSYEEAVARARAASTACSCRAGSARAGGRGRSSPAASPASARSRTSASASGCTSPSRSSPATSPVSTAPTRPRWTRRRRIP